ncbi:MAG: acyl carrier protein [Lachnospiraceae bacterium]|jgi:acyl carrier protein|nr:acyl carrier protein [Lachnospiraceae bacterium]SEI38531.1 acyl carrier protein [Lachnospiraceae bacterium A10]
MDNKELEILKNVIAEVLSVDPNEIHEDTTFIDDLGADSLDVFQIIMGVEEQLDVEVDSDQAEKIVTVGDAVELIKKTVG